MFEEIVFLKTIYYFILCLTRDIQNSNTQYEH